VLYHTTPPSFHTERDACTYTHTHTRTHARARTRTAHTDIDLIQRAALPTNQPRAHMPHMKRGGEVSRDSSTRVCTMCDLHVLFTAHPPTRSPARASLSADDRMRPMMQTRCEEEDEESKDERNLLSLDLPSQSEHKVHRTQYKTEEQTW
jgi:hypothetical protein